jgi:hypothetical protein
LSSLKNERLSRAMPEFYTLFPASGSHHSQHFGGVLNAAYHTSVRPAL